MIEIIDCLQGSTEWEAAKLGVPSASSFASVLAGGDGKTRAKYLNQLAGEIMSGAKREVFRGKAMERGTAQEPSLRKLYEIMTGNVARPVDNDPAQRFNSALYPDEPNRGFVVRSLRVGVCGASPDAFVGDDGVLETKSQAADLLIETMKAGRVPSEHIAQCQGVLFVTGREWCDLAIGYVPDEIERLKQAPGMPLFVRRVYRDSAYHARLDLALCTFNEELAALVEWIKKNGGR